MAYGQAPPGALWKIGDHVRFILGGPVMLVRMLTTIQPTTQEAVCQWFSKDDKLQEGKFLPEHLVPVERPSAPNNK